MAIPVGAVYGQTNPCDRSKGGRRWRSGSVEFLLLVWWWRPLGSEGNCQVMDDLVNDLIVGDEGDWLHLGAACRTDKRIDLVNLPYEFSPAWRG